MRLRAHYLAAFLAAACGNSTPSFPESGDGGLALSDSGTPAASLSKGLKLFVTTRSHIGDFADDPLLNGSSSIEKADDFCATDPAKPDGSAYKALLVDGVVRDAPTRTGWVLQPDTVYYRPFDDVAVAKTTGSAIFAAAFAPLTHPVDGSGQSEQVWTGIGDATTFATGSTCARWSDSTNANAGSRGLSAETDGSAFAAIGDTGCAYFRLRLYCAEQP